MKNILLISFGFLWLLNTSAFGQKEIEASTKHFILKLDAESGDLVGIQWKQQPDVQLIKESSLGENFRLLLPLAGYEANYFYSKEQRVTKIENITDGIICHYNGLKNDRQTLAVKVLYKIVEVNDQLQFTIDVDNTTSQPLAEVFFGIIGGQQGLLNRADTKTLVTGQSTNNAPDLFNNFQAGVYGGGNLGIEYSAGGFLCPTGDMDMPWMEIYNQKANIGVYYADQDTSTRWSSFYFELRPFSKSNGEVDNWPSALDLPAKEPIGLTMGWMKFPYIKKARFQSGPVVLQIHEGDWHEGSRIYRSWFDKHYPINRPPSWLRREQAWQSVIMSNSEDVIKFKFKDLPRLAADAKKYGVTTFEICGWDMGGIDRGYPRYRPDPRLGTREEFRKALADIKEMGVHPVIFANIQWADTHTPEYKTELHKYAKKGRWEDDLYVTGWGEGTNSARLGITRRNMTLISPSHLPFQQILIKQFDSLINDGADAFQFDKTLGMGLDFNPLLKTSPDRSFPNGVLTIMDRILTEGRKINPQLCLASESNWDRMFPYIDVSYMRMNDIDMNPSLKYTFPEWTATIFSENPGDFNIMNNGMRYGLVWASAPRHYNESMDEVLTQPLSKYIRELIRIREKYKDILFLGRFVDTAGATVEGGNLVRYSVFENMTDSTQKACVIVNFGDTQEKVKVRFTGLPETQEVEILQPYQQDQAGHLPSEIIIPPRTCTVVVVK